MNHDMFEHLLEVVGISGNMRYYMGDFHLNGISHNKTTYEFYSDEPVCVGKQKIPYEVAYSLFGQRVHGNFLEDINYVPALESLTH